MTENDQAAERARFEKWMLEDAKIIVGSSDPYPSGLERDYWRVWQAALAQSIISEEPVAAESVLRAFAETLIDIAFDGGSVDGGEIQDIAERFGLLKAVEATERCGEHCGCAEHEFPLTCYRKTDLVNRSAAQGDVVLRSEIECLAASIENRPVLMGHGHMIAAAPQPPVVDDTELLRECLAVIGRKFSAYTSPEGRIIKKLRARLAAAEQTAPA